MLLCFIGAIQLRYPGTSLSVIGSAINGKMTELRRKSAATPGVVGVTAVNDELVHE